MNSTYNESGKKLLKRIKPADVNYVEDAINQDQFKEDKTKISHRIIRRYNDYASNHNQELEQPD